MSAHRVVSCYCTTCHSSRAPAPPAAHRPPCFCRRPTNMDALSSVPVFSRSKRACESPLSMETRRGHRCVGGLLSRIQYLMEGKRVNGVEVSYRNSDLLE
ncbi:hypothetical protein EVAR_94109_1 [Eumeta japonica]|uniref:Uncharacterized protein n=1 Tax=Eumeta variegata TaxID=151549 RepID=A0A4C1U6W7_EUMVA|nr:hypothetical protein EVAR_94109_1 [Eumeta japonica]